MRKIHKNVPMLFEPFEWKVEEKNFVEGTNSINETIFCIGNGYLGIRGFFEEGFYGASMHTMRTTMINGIYEYFPYNHCCTHSMHTCTIKSFFKESSYS